MFVQWTIKNLKPLGRSPWRGHISYRAVLVRSAWVGGKAQKTNRYLATVRFRPDRANGGGLFIKADEFLAKCRRKLRELPVADAELHKIMSEIRAYLITSSGPPMSTRLHNPLST